VYITYIVVDIVIIVVVTSGVAKICVEGGDTR